MVFQCRACLAKDSHIADLQAEVENLRKLVFPKVPTQDISAEAHELETALEGGSSFVPPTPSEVELELHRVLTGDFDDSQSERV